MKIQVTSVSKKEQTLSRAAAAVFVITPEDIRRSGATNIPDLLRMVPGLDVAQINSNTWAIAARGLNDEFANELLVLVDGRNVYSPTFGGVFWELLDLPLEDIERIEMIRGPGGSIWGANAVNGVINIITKKADETRGAMALAGGGNIDQGFGTVQYGGGAGQSSDYRIYAKYFNQDHLPSLTGANAADGWHILRSGFRSDSQISSKDTLMFEGELFSGREGSTVGILPSVTSPGFVNIAQEADQSGGSIQSVWNHTYSARSDSMLTVSYSRYESNDVLNTLLENRGTFSADFQDHVIWGERQDLVWGVGYSYSSSHSVGDFTISLNPADLAIQEFNSFVQDEIAIVPNRLYLTAGTKLEHNHYTGFNLMPTIRAAFLASPRQTVWAAVSHADRIPASIDTAIRYNFATASGPGGVPELMSVFGNPDFQNETLIAYEFGYRTEFTSRLSLDFAAFYNDYDHQETTEPLAPFLEATPAPAHLVIPFTYENLEYGEEHGMEIAANWKVADRWTLSPGYDFARFHMHTRPPSQDTETPLDDAGSDPHMHAKIRSHVKLSSSLSWDVSGYFTDRLVFHRVRSYTRIDTGLSWQFREGLSFAVVGQNLAQDHHVEFAEATVSTEPTQVKRSAYAKFSWQF